MGHVLNGKERKAVAAITRGANAFQKCIVVSGSGFVCGEINYLKPNCLTTGINKPGIFPALDQTYGPLL